MKSILILFITLVSFQTIAGIEHYSDRIEQTQIFQGEQLEVYDARYFEMETNLFWASEYKNLKVKNNVQIGFIPDEEIISDELINVSLLIEWWEYDQGAFVLNQDQRDLTIEYLIDGTMVMDEKSSFIFEGGHRIRVTVQSISGPTGHIYLETNVDIDRLYNMGIYEIVDYGHNFINYSTGALGMEPVVDPIEGTIEPKIEFWWEEIIGAEEYELEWTFISNYDYSILLGQITEVPATDLEFNFYDNSTRIRLSENHYDMPGVFNRGYIVYRIRPIGRQFDNPEYRLEGDWSFIDESSVDNYAQSSANGVIQIGKDFENGTNWAYTVSYAEEGKRFEGIAYKDGMGRSRQSLRHNTMTSQVLINNIYFDKAARPVIADLPTPSDDESFSLRSNFNRIILDPNGAATEALFTLDNYLLEVQNCELPNPMSLNYGAGKYYSSLNLDQDGANANIPDAEGYPFSKAVYLDDPTGRVREVGSAGKELQTSVHGTKLLYETPTQTELNKLFGTEVGLEEHYQKTYTVDQNGQAYVEYTDLAGRTIANAMAGSSPAGIDALPNNTGGAIESVEVYNDGDDNNLDPLIASYTYNRAILDAQEITLDHQFDPAVFEDALCINGICFDCHYTYEISVVRTDCPQPTPIYEYTEVINGFVIDQACDLNAYENGLQALVFLEPGEYAISKTLKVNDEMAELYWCEYIDNADPSCKPDYYAIYNSLYDNTDFGCDPFSGTVQGLAYCDLKRIQLIADMAVGGQYGAINSGTGAIDPSVHPLSIYNPLNQLPFNLTIPAPTVLADWKNPVGDYLNDDGSLALILVTPVGGGYSPAVDLGATIVTVSGNEFVHPEDLFSIVDFVAYAQQAWGEALITYHPEYCYLEFCEQHGSDFHVYSEAFNQAQSFDEACASGLFSPLGTATLPAIFAACNNTPAIVDDFFTTGYFTGNLALWAAENYTCVPVMDYSGIQGQVDFHNSSLDQYYEVIESGITTGTLTIWEYAIWQAACQQETTFAGITACIATVSLDDCNQELIWQEFKQAYATLRDRAYLFAQTAYVTFPSNLMGGGCGLVNNACFQDDRWKDFLDADFDCLNAYQHSDWTDLDGVPATNGLTNLTPDAEGPCSATTFALYLDMIPRFSNFYNDNVPVPFGTDLTTSAGVNNFISSQTILVCQDYCTSQADFWLESLSGCLVGSGPWDMSNSNYAAIHAGFIEVCAEGCDLSNPLGSSTLPVGVYTASGYNSFEDVLEDVLGVNYETLECSHYLISNPAPVGMSIQQAAYQPLDTCVCNKVLRAQFDFAINTDPSITSVVEMLAANEGISYDLANSLACACDQEYSEHHGVSWTPSVLTAGWLQSAQDSLIASGITVPEELACGYIERCSDCITIEGLYDAFLIQFPGVETDANFEVLLENYMNFSLGYSLSSDAYESFIESCNSTSNDPYCYNTQLAPVFVDLIDVITRRGQLTSTSVDLSDNIVFINSTIGGIIGGTPYDGTVSGNDLTMNFGSGNVTLTIPGGSTFDFDDIISVYDLTPVPCSTNDEFTLVAKIVSCGQITEELIYGETSDFDLVNCFCGVNNQELCDSPNGQIITSDCYIEELIALNAISLETYQAALDDKKQEFIDDYLAQCATAFATETLDETSQRNLYEFTLFYYDQAGNLIQTVSPEGVDLSFNAFSVDANRNAEIPNVPNHEYKTVYEYNSYNRLVTTTNPDQEGYTKYWYDRYGRLVASQNPVQANASKYSYSMYDAQGRVFWVGQVTQAVPLTEAIVNTDDVTNSAFTSWVNAGTTSEMTFTQYDRSVSPVYFDPLFASGEQENLRLRVAAIFYYPVAGPMDSYESATYYSYDQHGNVIEQIQDVPMLAPVEQDVKSTQYEFKLVSGNVYKVIYQEGKLDQFIHEYHYDELNRIQEVYTSSDGVHLSQEAKYFYYDFGKLSRIETGDQKVQGSDFAYTINGWMKGMNASTLDVNNDMGHDGVGGYLNNTNIHTLFAADVNAYSMGYYDGDYVSIGNSTMEMTRQETDAFELGTTKLYNGNISHVVNSIYGMTTMGNAYRYDQLQRLKSMTNYYNVNTDNSWSNMTATQDYYTDYSYDKNGNIDFLQRNGTLASGLLMDDFEYNYIGLDGANNPFSAQKSNRLNFVDDNGADDSTVDPAVGDIKGGMATYNYNYDELGQLTKDVSEGILSIEWRSGDRKIKSIVRATNDLASSQVEFVYNPFGVRVLKIEKPRVNGNLLQKAFWKYTYYTHDASGKIMAVYDVEMDPNGANRAYLDEQHIYGPKRLGMLKSGELIFDDIVQLPIEDDVIENTVGLKRFECTNRLGNVQAVISDRKVVAATGSSSVFEAVVLMTSDYYPFGMAMPGTGSFDLVFDECGNLIIEDYFETTGDTEGWVNVSDANTQSNGVLVVGDFGESVRTLSAPESTSTDGKTIRISFDIVIAADDGSGNFVYPPITIDLNNGGLVQNQQLTTAYQGHHEHEITLASGEKLDAVKMGAVATMTLDNFIICEVISSTVQTSHNPIEMSIYRYAFNGMERDNEVKGIGSSYTTEFRQYDPRLGRWLSLDPLMSKYPYMSPYAAFNNNPIYFTDPYGLEGKPVGDPIDIEAWKTTPQKTKKKKGVGGMTLYVPQNGKKVTPFKDYDGNNYIGNGKTGVVYKNVTEGEVLSFYGHYGEKYTARFDNEGNFTGYWTGKSGEEGHHQYFNAYVGKKEIVSEKLHQAFTYLGMGGYDDAGVGYEAPQFDYKENITLAGEFYAGGQRFRGDFQGKFETSLGKKIEKDFHMGYIKIWDERRTLAGGLANAGSPKGYKIAIFNWGDPPMNQLTCFIEITFYDVTEFAKFVNFLVENYGLTDEDIGTDDALPFSDSDLPSEIIKKYAKYLEKD
jgi:RHS repeat-associated protein